MSSQTQEKQDILSTCYSFIYGDGHQIPHSIITQAPFIKEVYDDLKKDSSCVFPIQAIKKILKKNGFDGLPKVLENNVYQKIKGSNILEIYRGFKHSDEVKQFKYGDFFVGEHIDGNAAYFTTEYLLALSYARKDPDKVIRAKIDLTEIKILDYNDLRNALYREADSEIWFSILGDVGNYAAAKNIDVLKYVEIEESVEFEILLILNRSKLIIEKDPIKVKGFLNKFGMKI